MGVRTENVVDGNIGDTLESLSQVIIQGEMHLQKRVTQLVF